MPLWSYFSMRLNDNNIHKNMSIYNNYSKSFYVFSPLMLITQKCEVNNSIISLQLRKISLRVPKHHGPNPWLIRYETRI